MRCPARAKKNNLSWYSPLSIGSSPTAAARSNGGPETSSSVVIQSAHGNVTILSGHEAPVTCIGLPRSIASSLPSQTLLSKHGVGSMRPRTRYGSDTFTEADNSGSGGSTARSSTQQSKRLIGVAKSDPERQYMTVPLVATGSSDGSIRVWNLNLGQGDRKTGGATAWAVLGPPEDHIRSPGSENSSIGSAKGGGGVLPSVPSTPLSVVSTASLRGSTNGRRSRGARPTLRASLATAGA